MPSAGCPHRTFGDPASPHDVKLGIVVGFKADPRHSIEQRFSFGNFAAWSAPFEGDLMRFSGMWILVCAVMSGW